MLFCSAENCEKEAHSIGLCRSHWRLYKRQGTLEKLKISAKTAHPLYATWNANRKRGGFVKEWLDDFWKFVADVNGKPDEHRLTRPDLTKPYGPDNFKWIPLFKPLENEDDKSRRQRQRKQKRIDDPDYYRKLNYKYNFDLPLEEYNQKLAFQNFVCDSCKKPERSTYRTTKIVKALAVDHCHTTKKLRGLLCSRCNILIGLAKDDIEILQNAIDYLKRY